MNEVVIICSKDGPLRVSGSFIIKDADGNAFDLSGRDTISLCRCGMSANKPFCDGTHKRNGFSSEVRACKLAPPVPKTVI